MNDTFSEIDIYQKAENQNAFPIIINFTLQNNIEERDEEIFCDFIKNNAVDFFLQYSQDRGQGYHCIPENAIDCRE